MTRCPMTLLRTSWCALALVALLGCAARGNPDAPIPTTLVPASAAHATRLVVVLPGRGDDLEDLRDSGVAQAVQSAWPDADVLLAELTLPYYKRGNAPRLLHTQVIEPARARGYRQVWLAGASMGGMGTLLYEAAYPGEMDGLVLLAPYLGDRELLGRIDRAGGVAAWDPGPPQTSTPERWQIELWRHIQSWTDDPGAARRVWLAYGDRDRLQASMPLLMPVLPAEQVLVREGGHNWSVWSPALGDILRRARSGTGGSLQLPQAAASTRRDIGE